MEQQQLQKEEAPDSAEPTQPSSAAVPGQGSSSEGQSHSAPTAEAPAEQTPQQEQQESDGELEWDADFDNLTDEEIARLTERYEEEIRIYNEKQRIGRAQIASLRVQLEIYGELDRTLDAMNEALIPPPSTPPPPESGDSE